MSVEIGDRVGAILSGNDREIFFLGFGVYQGRCFGGPLPYENPKILLDNGKVVWGCQCWWGPEKKIKQMIEGKTIIDAIDQIEDN